MIEGGGGEEERSFLLVIKCDNLWLVGQLLQ